MSACYNILTLDTNGRVCAWGFNNRGQWHVGHGNRTRVSILAKDVKEYEEVLLELISVAHCTTASCQYCAWEKIVIMNAVHLMSMLNMTLMFRNY